ncbi:arsenic resistance protein [Spirochaeta isovalerica]|uniref:ACR3 family arsenite efflux pump ArsB n=1 Tax=Spirochaeta isovalerica TaxID=150 RepID=A0A841RGS0_9SPIO|nr:arsenic resistance protein [Spirochaeta isovalerica]MBB6482581.1 ACR3 family arsenite efflux pump ArsB [Spirochaeta isovalerica]
MWKVLKFLKEHLVYTIPVFMVLGFVAGLLFDVTFLKSTILFLTFLMVYPMMVNLQVKKLFVRGDNKPVVAAQLINFIFIPLVSFGLGKIFFAEEPMMIMGMLLIGLIPTSGMTISWTGFAKGNLNGAIKIQTSGMILGAILAPLYIQFLLGAKVEVPMMSMFIQIFSIVILPLVLGVFTRFLIVKKVGEEKYNRKIKMKFPLISTLGLFLMIFAAMALRAKAIYNNPQILLHVIVPIVLFYIINFLFSIFVGKSLFDFKNQSPVIFGTAIRNLSIALAIAMNVFGKNGADMALLISVAYIVQVEFAALYVKKVAAPAAARFEIVKVPG